ncbi:hepcidin isoform X1 [Diceros bicornis minor]|uniref:hepcidin isoform X1 n=1 Tax=Diceros bicornis minor TaxID=77932 RepID=UPI0026F25EE1|nr:hepcidin isoform X1 [Diceros bicornis minor]
MVLNTHIRAACLLLLLLASLTTGSVSPHQTRQLADLQTQDTVGTAGATAGLMVRAAESPECPAPSCVQALLTLPSFPQPGLHQLRRRDTHFPICTLCCGCCKKSKCGWCCKT